MGDVEARHFERAAELLRYLRRSEPQWLDGNLWSGEWIFRGQSDAAHDLLPTAWRSEIVDNEIFKLAKRRATDAIVRRVIEDNHWITPEIADAERVRALVAQHHFERLVSIAFATIVNDLGLPVPGNCFPELSLTDIKDPCETGSMFRPIVAIARHHRMPARVLDWTHNPLVAAFFAADNAGSGKSGAIAVWAAHRVRLAGSAGRELAVARSEIGYLHAQEGIFTYMEFADRHFLMNAQWPRLNETVLPGTLWKMTLPVSEALELSRLLWAERISKAHLMPTLDNVTSSLTEMWQKVAAARGGLR